MMLSVCPQAKDINVESSNFDKIHRLRKDEQKMRSPVGIASSSRSVIQFVSVIMELPAKNSLRLLRSRRAIGMRIRHIFLHFLAMELDAHGDPEARHTDHKDVPVTDEGA